MTFVLFTEGRFGRAVAERLEPRLDQLRVLPLISSAGSIDDVLDHADFAAVALWRRCPSEVDALDAACHRRGVRWTSAVLEDNRLRCGPLIHPHQGPCHACYRTRWLTHAPTPDREEVLDAAYAGSPARGIAGFTSSAVAMAAVWLLLDHAEINAAPGRLRRFDLLTCIVDETHVVRVHGCTRCSAPRPPGERYVRNLVAELGARRA